MYRMIVAAKVRNVWKQIDAKGPGAAVSQAAEGMTFEFVGDTAISTTLIGRQAFGDWFEDVTRRFPGLAFRVRDIVVGGWPWNTTAAVRLDISATLADGTAYTNQAVQFLRLRWGRMVDDWVIEDTLALQRALDLQAAAIA
jgi:ketosteroid isomerase-like protein